jgi:MFS family permease
MKTSRAARVFALQPIYPVTFVTMLVQGAHIGSRVVASLLALQLGAAPFTIGILIGVYAVFPLLLGVYSGRISDRYGPRRPMVGGLLLLMSGLFLPAIWTALPALFMSAMLIGTGFVFFNVSMQTMGGALGPPEERTRNFATLGLGYAGGHFAGPVVAGYAIQYIGYAAGYLTLATFTLIALPLIALNKRLDVGRGGSPGKGRSVLELLSAPTLRRVVVVSGLVTTGWDLFGFYVPIYGHSIGLEASTIGNMLGAFAVATFVVRAVLPHFTRIYGIERVLAIATFSAAILFVFFPLTQHVPSLFVLAFGIGLGLGCSQPLTLNLAYNHSPAGRSGEVTGLRLTINNIMHIGVPVAAGGLAALGLAPVFWTSAVLLVTSSYLTHRSSMPRRVHAV